MRLQSVGIVGYGAFGKFTTELLGTYAPKVSVRVFSRQHEPDGKTFFSLEEVCAADAVILAVPIRSFEETLLKVLPLVPKTSTIVDVATVKVYTTKLLKRHAADRRYLATHPMFGPESYKKTEGKIDGFRIVVTERTIPDSEYHELLQLLRDAGFSLVEISSDVHDKQLAETLFLTHFIGQVISRAGFGRTEIDSVSFSFLIKAVEIVKVNTELFKDVFRYNPYCEAVLDRLEKARNEVRALLKEGG